MTLSVFSALAGGRVPAHGRVIKEKQINLKKILIAV